MKVLLHGGSPPLRVSSSEGLTQTLYDELRKIARSIKARRSPGSIIQSTSLVHGLFLKLDKKRDRQWASKAHFLNCAALAMRRILQDEAQSCRVRKRAPVSSAVAFIIERTQVDDLIALDEVLSQLEAHSERMARIVRLKVLVGLTDEETASALDLSERTVQRDWKFAKAFLATLLNDEGFSTDGDAKPRR